MKLNLTISKKLILGFSFLLIIVVTTNYLSLLYLAEVMAEINLIVKDRVVKVDKTNTVTVNAQSIGRAVRSILLADTEDEREQFKNEIIRLQKSSDENLDWLEKNLSSEQAKALFEKINQQRVPFQSSYKKIFDMVEKDDGAAKTILFKEFIPANAIYMKSLDELSTYVVKQMHDAEENATKNYQHSRSESIITSIVAVILGTIFASWVIHSVTKPLGLIQEVSSKVYHERDFTLSVPVVRNDEIGKTAVVFNKLLETLRITLSELKQSIDRVTKSSEGLDLSSQESAKASTATSDASSSMAASIEQMSVSINHVSDNAKEASNLASKAGFLSEKGGKVIDDTIYEMKHIGEIIDRVASAISLLGEKSNNISDIVQVIKDVADQTNLLALNAAIEAARAGEAGRGFAVVADEVRKLAERTSKATGEISAMISDIQSSAHNAVNTMNESVIQVRAGQDLAEQAGKAINEIRLASNEVVGVVSNIADAIAEQSKASLSIAQMLEGVAQAAEENSATAQETSSSAHQLSVLAIEMRTVTDHFKI